MTVEFQSLGPGMVRRFWSALKTGNPGTLNLLLSCTAGLMITKILRSQPTGRLAATAPMVLDTVRIVGRVDHVAHLDGTLVPGPMSLEKVPMENTRLKKSQNSAVRSGSVGQLYIQNYDT